MDAPEPDDRRGDGTSPELPADPHAGHTGVLRAMRYPEFRTFWLAGVCSNTGTWMQTVTVPYVVDQLTHSTVWVGVSVFATFFPSVLIGPIAGSLSDRYERRRVLIWAQVVMMAMAAVLWATWATGTANLAVILVAIAIAGLGAGVTVAAWQSFVPQLVPPSAMVSAVRLNSMQFTAARAFGPAIAGLVLAAFGASAAFAVNAFSFLVVIGALLSIPPKPVGDRHTESRVLKHFVEGVRYAAHRPSISLAIWITFLVAFLGVSLVQLAEPLARHVFEVGAGAYGAMVAVYGAGALTGSMFLVVRGDVVRRSAAAMVGMVVMVIGDILLGVSGVYAVAVVALYLMGIAQVLAMVSANTSIQVNVDEAYRGRASSLFTMSFFAGSPVGALIGGVTAELIGLQETMVVTGVLLVAATVWLNWRHHLFRNLDQARAGIEDHGEVEVPGVPLATDLDAAAHLVVEPTDSTELRDAPPR